MHTFGYHCTMHVNVARSCFLSQLRLRTCLTLRQAISKHHYYAFFGFGLAHQQQATCSHQCQKGKLKEKNTKQQQHNKAFSWDLRSAATNNHTYTHTPACARLHNFYAVTLLLIQWGSARLTVCVAVSHTKRFNFSADNKWHQTWRRHQAINETNQPSQQLTLDTIYVYTY